MLTYNEIFCMFCIRGSTAVSRVSIALVSDIFGTLLYFGFYCGVHILAYFRAHYCSIALLLVF